jgi:16S rRNA G966 N2-methylase RsmD
MTQLKPILDGLHFMDCKRGMKRIPKASVDLIFTDPPYISKQWKPAYHALGRGAVHVLKPGGFCITYVPQYSLDQILDIMREAGLLYFWEIPSLNLTGGTALVKNRKAICLHKPIIIFSKPPIKKPPRVFCDVVRGKKQKAFHPWQQSIHDALGVITRFANKGDLLLDPFAGSGTSLIAAKLSGMRWIGFEIDRETFETAKDRLTQEPIDPWISSSYVPDNSRNE